MSDKLPGSSVHKMADSGAADSELLGEFFERDASIGISRPDLPNVLFFELAASVPLSRPSRRSRRGNGIEKGSTTALGPGVLLIDPIVSKEEVRWVAARRVISAGAVVTDMIFARDRSMDGFIGDAMSAVGFVSVGKPAVSLSVGATSPKPTTVRLFDATPHIVVN